jgi:hypothetical protein
MAYPHEVKDVHSKHHTYSQADGYSNVEYDYQEYPKAVAGSGDNEGTTFECADARQEANVKAGREPEQDAPKEEAPEQK